jgi:sialate O-acetylesterase
MKITGIVQGILLFFLITVSVSADTNQAVVPFNLPSIFSDHMVLQQQTNVSIWGWDRPGSAIAVTFRDREIVTQAELDGKWIAQIPTGSPGGPFTLKIQGTQQQQFEDVRVGEVWIAGGQSNMWWQVSRCQNAEVEINDANYPEIRVWDANTAPDSGGWRAKTPQKTVPAEWKMTTPQTVGAFPGTAYFFARELHQNLNVPIGIVHLAVPNQKIEAFLSNEFVQANLQTLVTVAEDSEKSNQKVKPAELFNGMVYPAAPYSARGFIWWQGEANASESLQYRVLFPALIQEWRHLWRNEDAPFLFVELANFLSKQTYPVEEDPWPALRDAQKEALRLPKTGMISTIDILSDADDVSDIHPPNKQLAGHRLYLAAIANVYGESDLTWTGPVYQSVEFDGNKAIVTFDPVRGNPVGAGLMVKGGGELKGFALAGSDRRFFWADGNIEDNQVILTSEKVAKPVAVRYAWANNPIGNLYNQAGLPAFPFRSDHWTLGLSQLQFKNMELRELAAYIQRELMPTETRQASLWQQVYEAIGKGRKSQARNLIQTLRQQSFEEAQLNQALRVLNTKLQE